MTPEQYEDLLDLWDEGYSMSYIHQATGIDYTYIERFSELWYDVRVPIIPSYNAVLTGVNL